MCVCELSQSFIQVVPSKQFKIFLTNPVTALPAVAPKAHAAPRLFEKAVRNILVVLAEIER
jgi:hypothetical protein